MSITCDRCGREMNDRWEIEGMPGVGGNCGDGCGDNLCAECGSWNEEGLCKYCAMSLEDLEYKLPMTVQCKEERKGHCAGCERVFVDAVTYVQKIYRFDDYFKDNHKKRIYEISYRDSISNKVLFCTSRHHTFREALTEAHITLKRLGLNKGEE